MGRTYYITTAIDYTNAAPHLGHAYEKVLADVFARYRRMQGREVFFLTGVDQHGQKVQMSAARAGLDPAEFAGANTAKFLDLWTTLGLSHDGWAATTDPRHIRTVRGVLQTLKDKGLLYKESYSGFYSVRQEQFLTDKERGPDGMFGPEWGEVVELEEANWYFRLAEHRDWLTGFLKAHPDAVFPPNRHAELSNAVERLSGDLCISRPKSRLSWGIELPFDTDYVTYVWFDALINYISFAGYLAVPEDGLPDFHNVWPADAHIIGKDILSPAHGIYWLAMLHAMGFADGDMPRLVVHGFWNMGGAKMSKSLGNLADPAALADEHGAEALRYYLMRDVATGQDADFSEQRLIQRYNAELANTFGNLLNRTLSMTARYRAGRIPQSASGVGAVEELHRAALKLPERYAAHMDSWQVHNALEEVLGFANLCNATVESTAPWKLAKDPARSSELDAVLRALAESLRYIAVLLSPAIPASASAMLAQLKLPTNLNIADLQWGTIPADHELGGPEPLFPRIEPASEG